MAGSSATRDMIWTLQRTFLPLLLFPLLSAWAYKLIFGNLFSTGLAQSITSHCHPSSPPSAHVLYMLPYTGFPSIDSGLCGMVFFFQEAMSTPLSMNFLTYFIGTAAPLVAIPLFNSYRTRMGRLIAYPAIWGLLTQIFTLGVIMPLYWLTVILTGGFRERAVNVGSIAQSHVQAAMFGIIAGAAIPSIGMLVLNDPYVTAIWQLYPLYVSLAQHCHLYLRGENRQPGSFMVQVTYIALFIISSSTHISFVWPILFDPKALQAFFLPSMTPIFSNHEMSMQILDFLKWDLIFGFGSTILATFWTSNNYRQLCALWIWYIFLIPIIGPGSAVLGAVLWYEFGRKNSISENCM
ncbi:hypothetical protein BDQ17DRAFT_1280999 [Cyathus striatus]|nr:hypothetical protein BDQ17DRAFT_1280999 [Cyathus striatus]